MLWPWGLHQAPPLNMTSLQPNPPAPVTAIVYRGNTGTNEFKYAVAGADIDSDDNAKQLRITFLATKLSGIGRGAKYQVEIPSSVSRNPFNLSVVRQTAQLQ